MWSNTRRGVQFLEGTLPKIARALERIARALENQVEKDEEDITRRVLYRALELNGGRSIHIAEMIEELERKSQSAGRVQKVLDLSTAHVPSPNPDWGTLRAVEHDHGWIVFINPNHDGIPMWWRHIGKVAEEHDCLLVNFDSAADTIDSLETWEW